MPSRGLLKEIVPTLRLAVPISLGIISHMLIQLTDTLFLGHYGTNELAASAFAGSLIMLILYAGLGFGQAVNALSSQALGANNFERARGIYRLCNRMAFLYACLGIAITLWLLPAFDHLGQPPLIAALGKPYALVISVSFIPVVFFQNLRSLYEAHKRPWVPFGHMVLLLVLNIFFNWALIFGKFGLPALGIIGSGLGTLLARSLIVLIFFFFAHKKGELLATSLTEKKLPWGTCWDMLKIATMNGLQMVVMMLTYVIGGIWIGSLGAGPIAANRIVGILDSTLYMIPYGIGAALCIRIGHAKGAADMPAVCRIYQAGFFLTLGFCAFISACFCLFQAPLTQAFSRDPNTLTVARGLLLIAALYFPFDNLANITLNALRGLGDYVIPPLAYFGFYWLIGLPLSYALLFCLHWGAPGVWWGYSTAIILASVFLMLRFRLKTAGK